MAFNKKIDVIYILWVGCILPLLLPLKVEAKTVRVLIIESLEKVILDAPWDIVLPDGTKTQKIEISQDGIIDALRITSEGDYININGKRYRGLIEIRKGEKGIYIINELDLEDYLKGVLPQEMNPRWEMEALKVQAVAARTYTLYRIKKNDGKEYDLCATILSQLYNGMDGESFRTTYAIMETEGLILTYEGETVEALYHGSCGGHTEDYIDVWPKDNHYLKGVGCVCSKGIETWQRKLTLKEIEDALRKDLVIVEDKVLRVEVGSKTDTERVRDLKIWVNNGGSLSIRANDFRRILGYTRIPSAFFTVEEGEEEINLIGKGAGHGVGLCQLGAKKMAEMGADFKVILRHYYSGVDLTVQSDQR